MTRPFRADLHLHSCLSPCAEIDMTPREIVRAARKQGLHIIAITDHNSAENAGAAQRAAEGTGLLVLAGMEITSSEEVHLLGLFEDLRQAMLVQDVLYQHLTAGKNDERLYGHQIVVNEKDEVMGFNSRLLIGATHLPVKRLLAVIESHGGLAIASHVDKESFSILSQLGFIPPDLHFHALEFSPHMTRERAERDLCDLSPFPWVSFSDAHHVADIGRRTTVFYMEEPSFKEIRNTFSRSGERHLSWG